MHYFKTKIMRKFVSVSFLLFLFVNVLAQEVKLENPKFVSSIEGIKEFSLSNGLQVLLIPDASQSNMVVNIVYKVGSRHEGYGETGMAHLLEHMLFKSTKKLGDIKKMLADKGGNANGTTWYDRTNYYEIFPASDENLKWSLEMEADRMINATMLQSDLDTEFSVVRNEFEIGENDPSGVLMERVISTAYLWHNYGNSTIGSKEDIERVKTDRLKVFYEKYYQPDNATLIIAGKFDEAKALQYVAEYFSVIPRPSRVMEKTYTVEPAQDGERFVELKRTGDVQTLAAVYHTAPYADKDFAALAILMEVLKSDPSGYLYKALIDTQIASSLWGFQPTLRDASFAYFNVEVPKDKDLNVAKATFLDELNKIGQRAYTEDDLKRGKSKVQKQIENTSNNTIGLTISLTEIIGAGDYRLRFLFRDNVENITTDDLNRVAAKYFKANNRTFGIFIPSPNEERVKGTEYTDEQIVQLTQGYVGQTKNVNLATFDANIANIKKNLTTQKLKTGFEYAILKKPVKADKVIVSLRAPVGNLKDLNGKSFEAYMMADMLNKGTKTLSKEQIQDQLDQMKSNLSFFFYGQTFGINISTYKEHLPQVMDLVHTILTEATFPETELSKLKSENKAWYESQLNDPQSIVFNKLSQVSDPYPKGHVLYTPSTQESIDGESTVTRDQILDFYQKYLGGNQAYGTFVGDLNPKEVDALMLKTFGKWTSKVKYEKVEPQFFESKKYEESILTPDKENGAVAGAINLKVSEKSADYPAVLMVNEMLGGGGFMTSRIPMRLREKEGISYGAGSYLATDYDVETGSLGLYAFYNPTLKSKVDGALKEEIGKLIQEGFATDEFKNSIVSWQNLRNTDLGNDNFLTSLINASLENKSDLAEFDALEAKVLKLTVDEVNAAVKKYLDLEKLILIYAGDFNKK
jgi:zinc protease